jgi:aminoacyl tRNA synthase complex-interacting multifunctional protein 1
MISLKPVKMRGISSAGMLLCGSGKEKADGIEFVIPPEGSQPGDKIYFEGFQGEYLTPRPSLVISFVRVSGLMATDVVPEAQLNPKKKIFETFQPDFTSLDDLSCAWIDPETKKPHFIVTDKGKLRTKSIVGANLS